MEHYLDQAATTRPSEAARNALLEAADIWGNPSSVHAPGQQAAAFLRQARATVAKTFGMQRLSRDLLVFTSCGTEANNIAMLGCAAAKKRHPDAPGTILLSAGEHPSIERPAQRLEAQGYTVLRVPTAGGVLDLNWLEDALRTCTVPVIFSGFMLVNNETGAVYDVRAASALVKKYFPDAVTHCDAVQGYMKVRATPAALGVDTMAVSSHKIHAIRGAGALYLSETVLRRKNIVPVMPGGGQENDFRSGTENLCSIASFAAAAEDGRAHFAENTEKTRLLRARLDAGLEKLDVHQHQKVYGAGTAVFQPGICSLCLPAIRSETMLNYLSGCGIYVSAGSACSAHAKKSSAALEAFGVPASEADTTLRVSFDATNTEDDVDAFLDALGQGIATLQRKR